MRWDDLGERIDELVEKTSRDLVWDVKSCVSGVFTRRPAGYFYQPDTNKVAVSGSLDRGEFARCKSAAAKAVGKDSVRENLLDGRRASSGEWIKIAYSPTVRSLGENLNFLPGTHLGAIPNHPSPLAAMLASALVGGGLGYGAGWLGKKLLPNKYGDKLKYTGAVLGALAGASPGALWALTNNRTGHSITDPWPFDKNKTPVDSPLADEPDVFSTHHPDTTPDEVKFKTRGFSVPKEKWVDPPDPSRFYPELHLNKLGSLYEGAIKKFIKKAEEGDYFPGFAERRAPTPYDVNINHLGQTLWQAGASNPLVGAAVGTMYAAQQMPDPERRPGWATGNQLGQLAMNAGKDYVSGLALGALVNTAVGTPFAASSFGLGNAALGLVRAGMESFLGS